MLMHAAHAADHAIPPVVIRSPDSYVVVIVLAVTHQVDTQLFRTRTHHRTRYLDLTAIGRVGLDKRRAMPSLESSSVFTGRAKVSGFRLLITKRYDDPFRSAMAGIGQSFIMSAEQVAKEEQAICTLYGKKQLTNVNTASHRMLGT